MPSHKENYNIKLINGHLVSIAKSFDGRSLQCGFGKHVCYQLDHISYIDCISKITFYLCCRIVCVSKSASKLHERSISTTTSTKRRILFSVYYKMDQFEGHLLPFN